MGTLSGPELAGERLTVAYETKDPENEHSCFSDTTHLDVRGDALGIQNICLGSYQKTDGNRVVGRGICELVRLHDFPLGERLAREIEASVNQAQLIPAPFDQAILGSDDAPGRTAIQRTVAALQRQTQTLSDVAAAFDIRLSLAGARR
jgi:putative iron-regulated protein